LRQQEHGAGAEEVWSSQVVFRVVGMDRVSPATA
jgi:hypothetical protein